LSVNGTIGENLPISDIFEKQTKKQLAKSIPTDNFIQDWTKDFLQTPEHCPHRTNDWGIVSVIANWRASWQ
jgi:hypothetical protein